METRTIRFRFERETKGAHLFKEIDGLTNKGLEMADSAIGSIYLRKSTFGNSVPGVIVVTVAEATD